MSRLLLFFVSLIAFSCSNSDTIQKEETNNELKNKEYVDSIKREAVSTERNRINNEGKLETLMLELANSEEGIAYYKTEIPVQKDKLEQIKIPKLLRTPAERENQIRNKIQEISALEENLQEALLSQDDLIRKINSTRNKLGLKSLSKTSLKIE